MGRGGRGVGPAGRGMTQKVKTASGYSDLTRPALEIRYLDELPLRFGAGREHISTRIGIALYGPRSLDIPRRHPLSTKVGIVGSGRSMESAQRWMESCVSGVEGDALHDAFPGYTESTGFYASLVFDDNWNEAITRHDIASISRTRKRRDRFVAAVNL